MADFNLIFDEIDRKHRERMKKINRRYKIQMFIIAAAVIGIYLADFVGRMLR